LTTLADHLPALARAGLLPAVAAIEALAAAEAHDDPERWRSKSDVELLNHADGHFLEVAMDLTRRDDATGHPTAAHFATRALMTLARALERLT
jgi:hypothetical protein